MKKTLFFSALFLLLASYGFSQFEKSVEFGFQASPLVAFANVTDSDKNDINGLETNARMGFSFGLITNFKLADPVALSTGLNIVTRGFGTSFNFGDSLAAGDSKINFTSVDIPISLRFRSPELGSSGMHIMGKFGGAAELNVQTKNETTTTILGITSSNTSRDTEDINLFTFSFVPGAGVDWVQDWGTVSGGVSYHWGLMNILKPDRNGDQNAKLSYVALDLAYFF